MDKLTKIKQNLAQATDGLNTPIDQGIFDLVTALNYLDFPTDSSCQGHPEQSGAFFPWVMIANDSKNVNFDNQGEYYKYAMTNLDLQKRFIPLLSEFYNGRKTEHQHRIFCNLIQCGMIEIMPQSGYISEFITEKEEREKLHSIYKQEFDDFKIFLESKF
ncbi:MAG TPA: hypothetical protein DCL21_03545 [Alphaproteobacteria bacterium]|nr:hypothetical protein [Alphaproteobacteria bacterium]